MKIETDEADPDHSPILADITAPVIMFDIEAILDCKTEIDATTTGAVHYNLTQLTEDTATDLTMTHHTNHIIDHPNIKALWVVNAEITVGHIHKHPTDPQDMNHADQLHIPVG